MNRAEATARSAAAVKRITAASPGGMAVVVAIGVGAWAVRFCIHLCIGFGTASVADVSAWWGLPFALVSAQTLGRLWAWARRGKRVRDLEEAADVAEREAAKANGGPR